MSVAKVKVAKNYHVCRLCSIHILSPSHTWQLFLEIQSNFHILVAKQMAKKVAKKFQANCYMCEFILAYWP